MSELKHSKLSCSGAYRWFNCPGSIGLSEGIEEVSSPFAQEGTKAHEILAAAITCSVPVADVFDSEKQAFNWSGDRQEHLDSLEEAQTFVNGLYYKYGVKPFVEFKVDLDFITPGMFGTCDICFVSFNDKEDTLHIHVADYKHGAGVKISAKDNLQLELYAAGVYMGLGNRLMRASPEQTRSLPKKLDIQVSIIQPRLDNIHTENLNLLGFLQRMLDIKDQARKALSPKSETIPGDHCRFCPAQFKCQTWCDEMVKALPDLKAEENTPAVDVLAIDKLVSIVEASDTVSSFMSRCKQELIRRMHAGEQADGYSLDVAIGNRKWISEEKVFEEFKGELSHSDMIESKLKSPAKLEKLLPIHSRAKVGSLTERPVNGFKLVKTNKQLTN